MWTGMIWPSFWDACAAQMSPQIRIARREGALPGRSNCSYLHPTPPGDPCVSLLPIAARCPHALVLASDDCGGSGLVGSCPDVVSVRLQLHSVASCGASVA